MSRDLCDKIGEALEKFEFQGTVVSWERYGSGHINDTFLVVTADEGEEHKYILQRMNHFIFKDPAGLMNNITGVTSHLREKIIKRGGDPLRETLNVVRTKDGEAFFKDSIESYWRVFLFIDHAISFDLVENPEDLYESGKAFGNFQGLLSDYPVEELVETIPDFHNTPVRYQTFLKAVKGDICGRASQVKEEIDFIIQRAEEYSKATDMLQRGELPLRVTHNDTKLNNIMIDLETRKGICVVDLDTIMPGLSMNDFGDAIRFGANTGLEDERDLSKISLSLSLFDIYTKGFLEGCEGRLTENEVNMLPMGAKLMTMECGIRFLTDYLQGDIYFKIHRENHNLDRTRTQLKLAADMEQKWDKMSLIVEKYK